MHQYLKHGLGPRRALVLVLAMLALLLPAGYGRAGAAALPGYAADFPDPAVLRVGDTFYAYGTNVPGRNLPVLSSADLRSWHSRGGLAAPDEALPHPAAWGVDVGPAGKEVWAPGVFVFHGRYIAFYAVRVHAGARRTCISVATSSAPVGPFVDRSSTPVVCDADPLGSIDPQPYADPSTGRPYLAWKSEGELGVSPTRLWSQRLDATGTRLLGSAPRRALLQTEQPWEGPIIENPSMIVYGGQWWLFYSGNDWASPRYAIGYARCAGPSGPCARAATRPLMASTPTRLGPGGASAFVDGHGRLRLAFHYWPGPTTGYPGGARRLGIATLHLTGTGHLAVG